MWVTESCVQAVAERRVGLRHGQAGSGGLGLARCGLARSSRVWHGLVWRSRFGSLRSGRSGWVRWGVVCRGLAV